MRVDDAVHLVLPDEVGDEQGAQEAVVAGEALALPNENTTRLPQLRSPTQLGTASSEVSATQKQLGWRSRSWRALPLPQRKSVLGR